MTGRVIKLISNKWTVENKGSITNAPPLVNLGIKKYLR